MPQVLTAVSHEMCVMRDESFGPVVGIMSVGDNEEAIRLINDSCFGLTASIWTRDAGAAESIGKRIETGTVFMNRCDHLDPALCWTGCKDTGRGAGLSTRLSGAHANKVLSSEEAVTVAVRNRSAARRLRRRGGRNSCAWRRVSSPRSCATCRLRLDYSVASGPPRADLHGCHVAGTFDARPCSPAAVGALRVVLPVEVAKHVLELTAKLPVVSLVERGLGEVRPLVRMRGQGLRERPTITEPRPGERIDGFNLARTQPPCFDAFNLLPGDEKVTDLGMREQLPFVRWRQSGAAFAQRVAERRLAAELAILKRRELLGDRAGLAKAVEYLNRQRESFLAINRLWGLGPSMDIWPARLWDGSPTREGRNARDSCFLRARWALRAAEPVRWRTRTCLSTWPASPSA